MSSIKAIRVPYPSNLWILLIFLHLYHTSLSLTPTLYIYFTDNLAMYIFKGWLEIKLIVILIFLVHLVQIL